MKICLVRHGETEWNVMGILQGAQDIPLNQTGRTQAARTGQVLSALSWDAVFTSHLSRAYDTGAAIAAACGLPAPTVVPNIQERDFGIFDGCPGQGEGAPTREQMAAEPTVEPREATRDRMEAALLRLCGEHYGKDIVVVSHGGALGALISRLFGQGVTGPLTNCSISLLEYREGAFHALDLNMSQDAFESKYGKN
jgi:broad specificity phosphatase PhoE